MSLTFSTPPALLALTETGKQQWHVKQVAGTPVQIERLDDWVSSRGLPNPDLIKLDVQGFELEVLRGAEAGWQRRWVLSEVCFREFYEGQATLSQLMAFLGEHGFEACAFGHNLRAGRMLDAGMCYSKMWRKLRSITPS